MRSSQKVQTKSAARNGCLRLDKCVAYCSTIGSALLKNSDVRDLVEWRTTCGHSFRISRGDRVSGTGLVLVGDSVARPDVVEREAGKRVEAMRTKKNNVQNVLASYSHHGLFALAFFCLAP